MWSLVDTIAVAFVALGAFIGFQRRLSGELAHLISMAVAVGIGLFARRPLGEWLLAHSRMSPGVAQGVALAGVVILSLLAMAAVRHVLHRAMRVVFEEHVDKTGGLLAGGLRAGLVAALVFLIMNLIPSDRLSRVFGESSFWGRLALRYTPALEEKIHEVAAEQDDRDE